MVMTFYFPKKAFLRKVKISICFLAFIKPQRANNPKTPKTLSLIV